MTVTSNTSYAKFTADNDALTMTHKRKVKWIQFGKPTNPGVYKILQGGVAGTEALCEVAVEAEPVLVPIEKWVAGLVADVVPAGGAVYAFFE